MSEKSSFENDLYEQFRQTEPHAAKVLIFQEHGETFSDALTRTATRVQAVMAQQSFKEMVKEVTIQTEDLISNVQFDTTHGWVYSVRTQPRGE